MINKTVDISLPFLWGPGHFIKHTWGAINYIVGPNGTGKSLLAEQIKQAFSSGGFIPRYLNAERLMGLERKEANYIGNSQLRRGFDISHFKQYKENSEQLGLAASSIVILKERLDIRLKIEALLSDIFGKAIRLAEEGGYLKPLMQNVAGGSEYSFTDSECHGLKELITLLTVLYDPTKNCIIFDEPELHLHPQFQSFFLEEMRRVAGNPLEAPSKKVFFIITHSPYFIDLRALDDLKNILVCQMGKVPTYINDIDANDQYILRKFLPRLNTHHKQFFFSPNPVFVEGYTDQQILSLLLEKLRINIGASGSCLIDVGGKDELAVFYRLCRTLDINCRMIADLDAILRGRLRGIVSEDARSKTFVQAQGIGTNLSLVIGELERHLSSIATHILSLPVVPTVLAALRNRLAAATDDYEKRMLTLLGIIWQADDTRDVLDEANIAHLNLIQGRLTQILNAFKTCNVYILSKGEIEDYYTQSAVDHLNITNKDALFQTERDFILNFSASDPIEPHYPELLVSARQAIPIIEVDIRKHLTFEVFEWVHRVQAAIARQEITNLENLKTNAKVGYALYSQILEAQSLTIAPDKTFTCSIEIKGSLVDSPLVLQFTEQTNAHSFRL